MNTALAFRPVHDADLAAICTFPRSPEELYYLAPRASFPLTPEQLAASIAQRSDSSVVCRGDEVLGFANIYKREAGACWVGNVAVAPQARRQGVARFLMHQMAGVAAERHGAGELRVSCFNTNTAGLLLYSRLGYTPFALEERLDGQQQPIVLIHLRLALVNE
ncbi:GNAT family N-acetyltransferase [Pseudomonas sp. GCM10022188]|uniref:GNAT family N-acetyltransferase n=1 Tax=Pseudomonas TaxID=286 RepID=UPI001E44651D|nr:GNAT family N-acetyltransferase [Pseudomonas oryzagri]MCC6074531.1 GNAT family N-acetyltransferase [Pseudomonas oryzagri]